MLVPLVLPALSIPIFSSFLCLSPQRALVGGQELARVRKLDITVDTREQPAAVIGELLPNLRELRLSNSIVSSVRDLGTSLSTLRVLWLCRCGLDDLDGISVLERLEELYVSFNDIEDVGPLALHDSLRVLDLEGNRVASLGAIDTLSTCPAIRELSLEGNPIAYLALYRRVVASRIPHLTTLDDRELEPEDREPLDPAVWESIEAAAKELEEDGEEGGGEAEEAAAAARLAHVLNDEEDEEDADCAALREESLVVTELLRSGAPVPEDWGRPEALLGLREEAILDHLRRPSSANSPGRRRRPVSASRARTASGRRGGGAGNGSPTRTGVPMASARLADSLEDRWARFLRAEEDGEGPTGRLDGTAWERWLRPRSGGVGSQGIGVPPSPSTSEPSTPSRQRRPASARGTASELTHGTGVALAGNLAVALRRTRQRSTAESTSHDQDESAAADGAGPSILATLDALRAEDASIRRKRPPRAVPAPATHVGKENGTEGTGGGGREEDGDSGLNESIVDAVEEAEAVDGRRACHMGDEELVQLLRARPKHVAMLRSRDSFRRFFAGEARQRVVRLMERAFQDLAPEERAAKMEKRLMILDGALA